MPVEPERRRYHKRKTTQRDIMAIRGTKLRQVIGKNIDRENGAAMKKKRKKSIRKAKGRKLSEDFGERGMGY